MGFKLAIGGLGLSTVSRDGQKTAEELADMETLKKSKAAPALKDQSSSDSDDGLPPDIQMQPAPIPGLRLNIGGLGLSTISRDGGRTAEEQADNQIIESQKIPVPAIQDINDFLQEQSINSGSDSDTGLPPPIPIANKPSFSLKIGGLGMSTLAAKDG